MKENNQRKSGQAAEPEAGNAQANGNHSLLTRLVLRTPLSPYRQSGITFRNYLRHPHLLSQKAVGEVEWRVFGRWLAARRPGNMVMFHVGRSGSTVLSETSKQHPRIYWDGEIYEKLFQKWERMDGGIEAQAAQADPLGFLKQRMLRAGRKYYGFEVKFFHLRRLGVELPDFIAGLREAGVTHFIILERKNYLRKIVSSVVAHQKKRFHMAAEVKTNLNLVHLDIQNIEIDRDRKPLQDFMQDYHSSFQELKQILAEENTLYLTYEEDVQFDPQVGYQRLCRFLDLEPSPASVPFGRINPYLLRDMLTNYHQVEEALKDSPYEWMLYE
jgi:hypothetical protein